MICIEFCIQKRILKFFGGSYFLGERLLNIPTFSRSDPKRLERGPQYSDRRRNFQKSQRTFVVLRWGYNPSTFRHVSRQNPRCPTQKTEKSAVFARFGTVFSQMVGAPRFSTWDVTKLAYPPVQTQNWKCTWGPILKTNIVRTSYNWYCTRLPPTLCSYEIPSFACCFLVE